MRLRHRIPALFGLSMLDVLCCGLGAVILLMLLSIWDARRQATKLAQARKAAELVTQTLEETKQALTKTANDLQKAEEDKKRLTSELADIGKRATLLSQRLAQAKADVTQEKKALALAEEAKLIAQNDLAASLNDSARIVVSFQEATKQADAARRSLAEAQKKTSDFEERLSSAQKRTKEIETEMAGVRKSMQDIGERMRADAQKQSQTAEIELATLRQKLEEQRTAINREKTQKTQNEDRFAGVDLRGRRVVFLVDTSGSMGSVDAQTPDANKWPEVSRTVVKLLRSLPEVEKFQVILFADETQFLLGKPDDWLDFDRTRSPGDVTEALARVAPRGNTNMYAACEAAFRYKLKGLDAIYIFSDGLPNVGTGLPAQPPQDEIAQSAILGKYLRDTIRNFWNTGTPRVQIHAVGFFYESPNLGSFLWALTRENGGSFVGMSKP